MQYLPLFLGKQLWWTCSTLYIKNLLANKCCLLKKLYLTELSK